MLTTSTMPRTGRGVGMNKSKKKKQVPVEPLQEPPAPMSCCEPAAPQVETFDERVSRVTHSMSPEKSRVVRLKMEMLQREEVCRIYRKCKRLGKANAKLVKEKMRDDRRLQNLFPKARTKKELATRKADEEELAAIRKDYHKNGNQLLVANCCHDHAMIYFLHAKSARLERLLRDSGGEW